MKTSMCNYRFPLLLSFLLIFGDSVFAQKDSAFVMRQPVDTAKTDMNMDAIYNRPFLTFGKLPVALGGYIEANTQYMGTDGINEGLSFQMRRMTLFFSSSLHQRIKFISEIEFEDGTKEIALETALMDIELHPLLNLRGGVLMNPIGAFNQNHDGPKWEFVDRPISAVQMLPATWSNVGFGLHGKSYKNNWVIGYETYLTNGFDNNIINNDQNKTFLPASKSNSERFEESNNGIPLFTGKLAIRNRKIGEIGFSYMGGVYNKFKEDGLTLDQKRRLDVWAIDFNTTVPKSGTYINAEFAFIKVDVPETFSQQYGTKQRGGFLDIVQPVYKRKLFDFDHSVINLALRLEYVDWNVGKFRETGGNIADEIYALVPAISWRPTGQTVLRLNYRAEWQKDLLGNPAAKTSGVQFGISTYF
jgi:hypothetical protein